MTDVELVHYVLINGALDDKTASAFADMASKLAAGQAALKPRQRMWAQKEHARIQSMAAKPPARKFMPGCKDKEFAIKDPMLAGPAVVNCGQLPLFPPGMLGNEPRHGSR